MGVMDVPAITGNFWLDVALAVIGFILLNAGIGVLLGARLPLQDRLPLPGSVLGATLLAAGTGLVAYFGKPDLVDQVARALAGS